jgi:hypothetical protein
MTKTKIVENLFVCNRNFIFEYNDWILDDKIISKLDKSIKKKGPTSKQNLNKRKTKRHKTYLPLAYLCLLSIDVGVVNVIVLLLFPKKWLFSYVPPC